MNIIRKKYYPYVALSLVLLITLTLTNVFAQSGRYAIMQDNSLNFLNQRQVQIRGTGEEFIRFEHKKTWIDELELGHVRYQVLYKNIPIYVHVLIVHLDESNTVVRASEAAIPEEDYGFSVEPTILSSDAVEIVENQMAEGATTHVFNSTLMVWNGELIDPSLAGKHLVWKIEISSSSPPGEWVYFIDAHDGEIVNYYNNLKYALDRKQYDAENCPFWDDSCLPGTFLFGEGGSSSDPDAQGVYDNLEDVYNYFDLKHGRDSYDDNSATIKSSVHVGDEYGNPGWNNAAWSSLMQLFMYGDGDVYAQALDIVAHEFTHAVTDYEANLDGWYQPGALNESYSDVFASLIDDDDWLLGEDLSSVIRSMEDPTLYGHPDHMDDYLITVLDKGGVHTNCGIPNKAFHYIATAFIDRYGDDDGRERTGEIYYYTLANLLT